MDEISNTPRPRVSARRGLVAAGVGVGLALGAAGIAGAASTPPSPKPGTTAKVVPGPGEPHRGGHHRGGPRPGMGLGGALHGELVVPRGTGFQTIDVQRGKVTAVSATSLTVKSADGFTKTYVLTAKTIVEAGRDGIATVKVGEKVGVLATVASDKATAAHVRDLTRLQAARKDFRPPPPAGAPAPPAGAAPSDYDEGDLAGA